MLLIQVKIIKNKFNNINPRTGYQSDFFVIGEKKILPTVLPSQNYNQQPPSDDLDKKKTQMATFHILQNLVYQ